MSKSYWLQFVVTLGLLLPAACGALDTASSAVEPSMDAGPAKTLGTQAAPATDLVNADGFGNADGRARRRMMAIRQQQSAEAKRFAFSQTYENRKNITANTTATGLAAKIDATGLHLSAPSGSSKELGGTGLKLRLGALGRPDAMLPLQRASAIELKNNLAVLHHGLHLKQWWQSGALGLEQGFELSKRPPMGPESHGPLVLRIYIQGARAVDDQRGGVRLLRKGRVPLRYTDLFAEDADNKLLPTRMVARGSFVDLLIDDVNARYPLRVDPLIWIEQSKLTASDGSAGDLFGDPVAVSGNTALVGARWNQANGPKSGAAYVFEQDSNNTWVEKAKLVPSDGAPLDIFGSSLALAGDQAFVGAPYNDDNGENSGCVYVFQREANGSFVEKYKLLASDAGPAASFGGTLNIQGDTLLVGANQAEGEANKSGAVYVFQRDPNGTWLEKAKLIADDGASLDFFGNVAAVSGDYAVVGAWRANTSSSQSGAAYIFERDTAGIWKQKTKLVASDSAKDDRFGIAVAIAGDYALVAAKDDDDKGFNSGSVYVFERDPNGTWIEKTKLRAEDTKASDYFGSAVSVDGDRALIGATGVDDKGSQAGAVYVFERASDGSWTQTAKVVASDGATEDYFGGSVTLQDNQAFISSWEDDDHGDNSGSAYVFRLGEALTQGAPCKAKTECLSGFCVDGVCCDSACGNGSSDDCQACSQSAGASSDGTCGPRAADTVCRASADACDAAEVCDGSGLVCPADADAADGSPCDNDGSVCKMGVCSPSEASAGGATQSTTGSGGNTGNNDADETTSGCGCRVFARPVPRRSTAHLGWLLFGMIWVAARRRSKEQGRS